MSRITRIASVIAAAVIALSLPATAHAAAPSPVTSGPRIACPSGYTPQGMTTWQRPGRDLAVQACYRTGRDSVLVAFNDATGAVYGRARVAEAHLGGIAIAGGWLIAQDAPTAGAESYRRYDLSKLAAAWDRHEKAGSPSNAPYVKQHGHAAPAPCSTCGFSYATASGDYVYAGHRGTSGVRVYEYTVSAGVLQLTGRSWLTPPLVDGLTVRDGVMTFISHAGVATVLDMAALTASVLPLGTIHGEGAVTLHGATLIAVEGSATHYLTLQQ